MARSMTGLGVVVLVVALVPTSVVGQAHHRHDKLQRLRQQGDRIIVRDGKGAPNVKSPAAAPRSPRIKDAAARVLEKTYKVATDRLRQPPHQAVPIASTFAELSERVAPGAKVYVTTYALRARIAAVSASQLITDDRVLAVRLWHQAEPYLPSMIDGKRATRNGSGLRASAAARRGSCRRGAQVRAENRRDVQPPAEPRAASSRRRCPLVRI